MERIFISSLARGEMGAVRQTARAAVESLDMHAVMFESGAAADDNSRRALLDRVASCDAMVLLLGAEYGEPGARQMSPTEEEFDEAGRRGIPVLPLVQKVDREPAQEDFLRRVRGQWENGRLTADFTDASDVGLAVVKARDAYETGRGRVRIRARAHSGEADDRPAGRKRWSRRTRRPSASARQSALLQVHADDGAPLAVGDPESLVVALDEDAVPGGEASGPEVQFLGSEPRGRTHVDAGTGVEVGYVASSHGDHHGALIRAGRPPVRDEACFASSRDGATVSRPCVSYAAIASSTRPLRRSSTAARSHVFT